jgi:signal peptidase I
VSKSQNPKTRSPAEAIGEGSDATKRERNILREYIEPLLVILLVALAIRTFVIHAYRIPSGSMEDTLLVGDYLLANRFVYGAPVEVPFTGIVLGRLPAIEEPQRGDIAIFASWRDTTEDFIKRVVGLPGDTVLVRDNVLYINGVPFKEMLDERFGDDLRVFPRIKSEPTIRMRNLNGRARRGGGYGPHIVAPGHLFVMGDNRHNSADSRYNGDVPMTRLKARAMVIYWSMDATKRLWNLAEFVRWNRIGRLIH